jgi:hypothetical protein
VPSPSQAIVRQLSGLSQIAQRITRRNPQTTAPSPYQNGDMSNYFGPGLEVQPIAPVGTDPRGWQYWINQNMVFTPRPDSEFTAQALRALATYPLARSAIENSKDVISNLPRQIRAKKKPGEKNADVDKRSRGDQTLKMLNDFFDCPDGEHDWATWAREWLEYLYTIDAASVFVQKMKSGRIVAMRIIDGAFITRLVDQYGYTPQPPDAAYQQLWSGTPSTVGGIPFVDLTTDQLIYRPRNIVPRNTVSSFLYGMSPTEQNAQEIQIGQERLNFVLAYYTTGTIPDAMQIVPPNVSPDQLASSQKALTAEMSGQPFKRSGFIKLIQGFVDRAQPGASSGDQFLFPKEKLLADPFDELHIRKIFYAYGASTQRIMKQMNRASAQTNQEAAEEEGTMPFALSLAGMVNWAIAKHFKLGFGEYEMTFDAQKELDVVKRSTADKNDVDAGIITRDESRTARGLDEVGGDAAKLMITTATGTVPVDLGEQVQHAKDMFAAKPPPAPMNGGGGGVRKLWGHCADHDEFAHGCSECGYAELNRVRDEVRKRRTPKIDPGRHTPDTRQAQAKLERAVSRVFMRQKEKATLAANRLLKSWKTLSKAGAQHTADEINNSLIAEWASLPVEARAAIEQAALSAVADSMIQIELSDAGLLSSANKIATEYAADRAAEMVGMKYNAAGDLVENPNAKWAISDTTRDRLREIVKNAFEEKTPFSEVIDDIRDADIFSESRAAMIARTEISNAQVGSNFTVWKQSGLVKSAKWLALGPDPCPICLANNNEVRPLGSRFTSGDEYPTAHPNCYCILQAVEFAE